MGTLFSSSESEPTSRLEQNKIEKDAKTIEKLLLSAKNGNWDQVWETLGKPEHSQNGQFINVIPENRRWGILHQAMYWNDAEILRRLLSYSSCDSKILSKGCTSECGDTSRKTPQKIAEQYGYQDLANILSKHENKIEEQDIPTFELYETYSQDKGLGLLSVSLAAYKHTFHPNPINTNKSITEILGDIYVEINRSNRRWNEVKEKVCDSVSVVCVENSNKIKKSGSRNEFFRNIIDIYTEEENFMYTYLNVAFRRQRKKNYRPTGNDLSLGPYAVMYQMLLLFWPELPRESGKTFRRMLLNKSDADKYVPGQKFVWQSIVSSSTVLEYATAFPTCGPEGDQSVIFEIDNKITSQWQPRNIEKYARYMENERTYPAGAVFKVTGRNRIGPDLYISLQLLPGN